MMPSQIRPIKLYFLVMPHQSIDVVSTTTAGAPPDWLAAARSFQRCGGQARRTIFLAWETGVLDVLLPELAALLYDDSEEEGPPGQEGPFGRAGHRREG